MNENPTAAIAPEEAAPRVARTGPSAEARTLFSVAGAAVAAITIYYAVTAKIDDPLLLYEGLVIMVLATLPGLVWARNDERRLPLFEVLLLTTANTFALPLFNGQVTVRLFAPEATHTAALAVILYQSAAIATYFLVGGQPGRSPFFTEEVISRDINRFISYGLTLTTVYTVIATFTDIIPFDLIGPLRAAFSGIGLIAVFVSARRWGLHELHPREKSVLVTNLVIQVLLLFSGLFLVGGISLLVLTLLGYVTGSRRLPLAAMISILLVVALLHNGKSAMRNKYWDADGGHRQPTITELPGFFNEWVQDGLSPGDAGEPDEKLTTKLLERTSLLHILCLVVTYTPDRQPFLNGETYGDIPGQFVPRFFWHDKPVGHISTYRLSTYYGLQREEDTAKTTIGFGMVCEAYANFGMYGVGLLGCVLGFCYKKVQTLCARSPQLSYAGLYTIVLMAWSFQTEWPMSMWLSSMFQACVAVMSIPFFVRNFLG